VCCSVLQCVAVCCNVLQYVAACCSMLQHVAACCSMLQCVGTFEGANSARVVQKIWRESEFKPRRQDSKRSHQTVKSVYIPSQCIWYQALLCIEDIQHFCVLIGLFWVFSCLFWVLICLFCVSICLFTGLFWIQSAVPRWLALPQDTVKPVWDLYWDN